ncbi:MAG: glutamate--cysteine ligase [Frankiaceae bacterium]
MRIPFQSSPRSSVGIEWELEIVDPSTRQLASEATAILEELGRGHSQGLHPKAKYELLQCTVEIITGVCQTVHEAKADLASTLAEVSAAAGHRGLAMMCSGTHPLSDWAAQKISPDPRYAKLIDDMQWPARRLQIFGVHVHVGVRGPEKAIPIVNALTDYIPHFLALSGSSPYWKGRDTGLASCRSKVFESLPTAGLPYQLSGWEEFEEFMQTLVSSKTIESIREVWWDIRPHPNFGTVELRICDGLPTLREVGAMAALSQCLVDQLSHQLDRGYRLPTPRSWIVRENKWRAARYGLDAQIISADSGETQCLRDAIEELVEELRPVAERLGCLTELHDTRLILQGGASYERQRAAAAASGGAMTAVVDSLLQEMRTDTPSDVSDVIDLDSVCGKPGAADRASTDAAPGAGASPPIPPAPEAPRA